jgi:hypothetical protein
VNQNDKIVVIATSIVFLPIFLFDFYYYLRNVNGPKINLKRILKYNLLAVVCLAVAVLILSHTNYLNYGRPIPYKNVNQITFKDFRGLELFRTELFGSKYFAYVVTSIDLEKDDDCVTVTSYFHPSRSFVYNNNTSSRELFNHELYHFRITEVFARKARKIISERKNIPYDEIERIVENARVSENAFQQKYDSDTYHSYVFGQQKKYEKDIDSLLYLTRNYQNPKIKFHENN